MCTSLVRPDSARRECDRRIAACQRCLPPPSRAELAPQFAMTSSREDDANWALAKKTSEAGRKRKTLKRKRLEDGREEKGSEERRRR